MLPHITLDSKGMTINLTLAWVRMAYAWFEQAAAAGQGWAPVIVDADDIMHDRAVVRTLVVMLGGEPNELLFSWDAVKGKDLDDVQPYARTFESTLLASEGVVEGKNSSGVTVEGEMGGWVEEFGRETAENLKGFVEGAMSDYEFLKARRLRAERKCAIHEEVTLNVSPGRPHAILLLAHAVTPLHPNGPLPVSTL